MTGKRSGFGIGEAGREPATTPAEIAEARRLAAQPARLYIQIVEYWTADGRPLDDDNADGGRMEVLHRIPFDPERSAEDSRREIVEWIAAHRADLTWTDESPDGHGFSAAFPDDAAVTAYVAALRAAQIATVDADDVGADSVNSDTRACWECGMTYTRAEVVARGGVWSGDNPFDPGTCYCGC